MVNNNLKNDIKKFVAILSIYILLISDNANAVDDNSTIEFADQISVHFDSPGLRVLSVDTNGYDIAGANHFLYVSYQSEVGSIVDLGRNGNALATADLSNKIPIKFTRDTELTLTGRGSEFGMKGERLGFYSHMYSDKDEENAPADNYSALENVEFTNTASRLKINANSGNAINLPKSQAIDASGYGATLDLQTDLIVNDASFATIDHTIIAAEKSLTINSEQGDINTTANTDYIFGNANSKLVYNVALNNGSQAINFLSDVVDSRGDADGNFKITFGAFDNTNSGNILTIASNYKSIGKDQENRAQEVRFVGTEDISISNDIDIFAKNIVQANYGEIIFNNNIKSGANSSLKFKKAGKVKFSAIGENEITNIDFNGRDGEITLDNGVSFKGDVIDSRQVAAGSIYMLNNSIVDGSIGSKNAPIRMISANPNSVVSLNGEVYAEQINIPGGSTAVFSGSIIEGNGTLKMYAKDATSIFEDETLLNIPIEANVASDGIINFNSGVILNSDIGSINKVGRVDINNSSILSADIHADKINVRGNILLSRAVKLDGKVVFENKEIDLNNHNLKIVNSGDITLPYAMTLKVSEHNGNFGSLVIGRSTDLLIKGPLNVDINDMSVSPNMIELITTEEDGTLSLNINRVNVRNSNVLSEWVSQSRRGGGLVLLRQDAKKRSHNRISDISSNDLEQRESMLIEEKSEDNMNIRSNNHGVIAAHFKTIEGVTGIVNNRINSLPLDNLIIVTSEGGYDTGVAAGDEPTSYGLWATPFYSTSTQKAYKGFSGFKSESYGGIVGFDTKISENNVVGIALSAMSSMIKHKDLKSGDKTNISSLLLSAYTRYQITNNWFCQGVFSFGSSDTRNKEHRKVSNTEFKIAKGKYTSTSFSTELLGGYSHLADNGFIITPVGGLSYDRINNRDYDESGPAGTPLMKVKRKISQKFNLVGGVKLATTPYMIDDIAITPAAHVFLRHDMIGRGVTVRTQMQNSDVVSTRAKLNRTFYNVGANLNVARGIMDYDLSTDAHLASKYFGIQWAIKVRANF